MTRLDNITDAEIKALKMTERLRDKDKSLESRRFLFVSENPNSQEYSETKDALQSLQRKGFIKSFHGNFLWFNVEFYPKGILLIDLIQ